MKIEGHKVLVTGGSGGIGLAIARAFRQAGCEVAICGRDEKKLDAAAVEADVMPIRADVAEPEDLGRLPAAVEQALGGLSVLINNAGVQFSCNFLSMPPGEIARLVEREVRINLEAPAILASLFLPMLSRAPEAAIVNVSSGLALSPKSSAPMYCATKAGLHSFSKALRYQMEDAGRRIGVFEVLPPLVDTDMTRGRGGGKISPEDVAAATLDGMRRDRREIRVGKVGLLYVLCRLAPGMAERVLRRG